MTNEHANRCECGHTLAAHGDQDDACRKCGCAEYHETRVCSYCGNVHDPDVSADIAEDMK